MSNHKTSEQWDDAYEEENREEEKKEVTEEIEDEYVTNLAPTPKRRRREGANNRLSNQNAMDHNKTSKCLMTGRISPKKRKRKAKNINRDSCKNPLIKEYNLKLWKFWDYQRIVQPPYTKEARKEAKRRLQRETCPLCVMLPLAKEEGMTYPYVGIYEWPCICLKIPDDCMTLKTHLNINHELAKWLNKPPSKENPHCDMVIEILEENQVKVQKYVQWKSLSEATFCRNLQPTVDTCRITGVECAYFKIEWYEERKKCQNVVYLEVYGGPWKKNGQGGGQKGKFGVGLNMLSQVWAPALFHQINDTRGENLCLQLHCPKTNSFSGVLSVYLVPSTKKDDSIISNTQNHQKNNRLQLMTVELDESGTIKSLDEPLSDNNITNEPAHNDNNRNNDDNNSGNNIETIKKKKRGPKKTKRYSTERPNVEIKKQSSEEEMTKNIDEKTSNSYPMDLTVARIDAPTRYGEKFVSFNQFTYNNGPYAHYPSPENFMSISHIKDKPGFFRELQEYVKCGWLELFNSKLLTMSNEDRYIMLFQQLDKGVTIFHSIAFYGQSRFLDLLQRYYPNLYTEHVLTVKGPNQNFMFRSSVMKAGQEDNYNTDVFGYIVHQWLTYYGSDEDSRFRQLFQNVLRNQDRFENTIFLNLVEFERLNCLKFIKYLVQKYDDFLSIEDIMQCGEKGHSIMRILERYRNDGIFCNIHFPNQNKSLDIQEHEKRCKGFHVIEIMQEIFNLLKSRKPMNEEKEKMLVVREENVTKRENDVSHREQWLIQKEKDLLKKEQELLEKQQAMEREVELRRDTSFDNPDDSWWSGFSSSSMEDF